MRTWTAIAAALTLASAGVWAAVMPDQQGTAESGTQKRIEKRVTVSDEGDGPPMLKSLTWASRDVEIGVSIRDQDDSAKSGGAVVDDVRQDSPASRAGIKTGDVVVEFDGERVRSARHLSRLVEETASGHTVKLAVMRDGKRMDLDVTPEEGRAAWFGGDSPMTFEGSADLTQGEPVFKMAPHTFAFKGDGPFMYRREPGEGTFDIMVPGPGRGRLGVSVQELTPQLAEYFGTKEGALVTTVVVDSPASKAGIHAGDVITAVNDAPISSTSELIDAVRKANDGASVKLSYTRDHKTATATATLEAKPKPKKPSRPA